MVRRSFAASLTRAYRRNLGAMAKATVKASVKNATRAAGQVSKQAARAAAEQLRPPPGDGDWLGGVAVGPGGARRYHLFRPARLRFAFAETPPLMVMLHGCGQTGRGFAAATRMNSLAAREGFLVLYPEQELLAHSNNCWNWYDVASGKSLAEAATLMAAIDQVCLLYRADPARVAVAGLSAGAGMAALLATHYPARFKAVVMHSGVAPGAATSPKMALGAMRGQRAPSIPRTLGLPPLLVLHGDRDAVVSSRNAVAAAAMWAVAMDARPAGTRAVQRGRRHAMRVTDFKRRGRTMVTLCDVTGLGHAWSGGAPKHAYSDPEGPDATRMAWAFAARQFRATPAR
ncbi:PHB depolymerase family esterase [Methylopila sp. M107]|uniref:extracellular catalytic domain type 1 short-chain-length polyhydroxyalkanoate depolymerase n=1 Tax=Methylopila sp. M107 TaxID=1101190 RepID=UPI000373843D|nr:PHB depolymerase family esterase [Methylopila sp. M107]